MSDSKGDVVGLKPSLQVVYLRICIHLGDGEQPSRATLAEECSMTTRSIDRIISRLEQLKLISRERRFDGNKGQLTNLFTIANVSPKKASPKPVDDPEINQVLEEFTKVTGLKIINVRKQRDYAKRLLKREGKSNILDAIAFLQYISEDRYAPRVTDLEKLYFKWNDLMLYAKKKKLVPRAETKVDLTNL